MRYALMVILLFWATDAPVSDEYIERLESRCTYEWEREYWEAAVAPCMTAAKHGSAIAQSNLGWMYAKGNTLRQDVAKAAELITKAADQEYARAQYYLGLLYATGTGVPEDARMSAELITKAAEQGYAEAQYVLGTMYVTGVGVPVNNVKAFMWLDLATRVADKKLAKLAGKAKKIIGKQMTDAQRGRAGRLVTEWLEKSGGLAAGPKAKQLR